MIQLRELFGLKKKKPAPSDMARRLRRFEAAGRSRRTHGMHETRGDASATAPWGDLNRLRYRSRGLYHNNPTASSAVRKIGDHVVGTGIRPKAMHDSPRVRKRWSDIFSAWSESVECDANGELNLFGLEVLIQQSVARDGECLVLQIPRPLSEGLVVPYQLRVLEVDHLDTSKTERTENGGKIVQGVEYDRRGRRVAYWLFRDHPGQRGELFSAFAFKSERVSADLVLHIFQNERPGQVRGFPRGACCLLTQRDFEDWNDAALFRQKLANAFVGFVTNIQEEGQNVGGDNLPTGEGSDPSDISIEEWEPGTWRRLDPGEDIRFAQPPEAEGLAEASRVHMLQIAMGYGLPYELLTGDLQGVNFSGGRMGRLDWGRELTGWRQRMLQPKLLIPVWNSFAVQAALSGVMRAPVPARWIFAGQDLIEPDREVDAARDGARAGFWSWQTAVRRLGEDPDQVLEEWAEDVQSFARLGLAPESMPGAPMAGTPTPAADREPVEGSVVEDATSGGDTAAAGA